MSLLEVRNLRKSYGDLLAVEDVSFSIEAGEVFGLLGPNGAGKSTTMMMICGLIPSDSGSVEIDGTPLSPKNQELKRRLGVVPQDLAIYPELTARENLEFFGQLYGLKGRQLTERVDDALERIGLTHRASSPPHTFSGGMKRRLNFGCALLHRPSLLILDEPTVGIDPQSRNHLLESVRQLASEGLAVIYASHYMEEVEEVCHRVAIIDHGNVIAKDSLENLLGRMSHVIRLRMHGGHPHLPAGTDRFMELTTSNNGEWGLTIDRSKLERPETLNTLLITTLSDLREQGAVLGAIETKEPNLERLFLELTGSRLRD